MRIDQPQVSTTVPAMDQSQAATSDLAMDQPKAATIVPAMDQSQAATSDLAMDQSQTAIIIPAMDQSQAATSDLAMDRSQTATSEYQKRKVGGTLKPSMLVCRLRVVDLSEILIQLITPTVGLGTF